MHSHTLTRWHFNIIICHNLLQILSYYCYCRLSISPLTQLARIYTVCIILTAFAFTWIRRTVNNRYSMHQYLTLPPLIFIKTKFISVVSVDLFPLVFISSSTSLYLSTRFFFPSYVQHYLSALVRRDLSRWQYPPHDDITNINASTINIDRSGNVNLLKTIFGRFKRYDFREKKNYKTFSAYLHP